jgi:hypothetical protein
MLIEQLDCNPLLSSEPFPADGTLLRARACHSSLERIDGSDDDPPPSSAGMGFGAKAGKQKQ